MSSSEQDIDNMNEVDTSEDEKTKKQEFWPFWKLAIIAVPQLGVQILWMFLGPNTTPYLKSLGASDSFATLNNMAGPIVGFFCGPLVGTWSDQSTSKWGRRRPVIVAGLISTLVAGLLYSGAEQLLGEGDGALYMAAVMQWVLDFTINAMQTPFRALVADLASEEQQLPMQVFFAVVCSVGGFLAYTIMEFYEIAIHHMVELMSIILFVNIAAVGAMLLVAREKQFVREAGQNSGSACGQITGMRSAFQGMPKVFYLLLVVQCMVWLSVTVWGVYGKVWFTNIVYEGDAEAEEGTAVYKAYKDGAMGFSVAGQVGSFVQLLQSLAIMGLGMTSIPANYIYAPCIYVGGIVCFLCAFVVGHSHTLAFVCFVLSNIELTAAGSIAYGLVAQWNKQAVDAGKVGSVAMQMAILNCCITIGQQLCTMILGGFETHFSVKDSLKFLFIISMVACGIGGTGALFLGGRQARSKAVESQTSCDCATSA